jgi:REP element-mobilizing transposase RayT
MTQTTEHQHLGTSLTTWHVTWGTYGARLHGDDRATVDRFKNKPGDPYVEPAMYRARVANDSLRGDVVYLTREQQEFVQAAMPEVCVRGGWTLRTCAAAHDHVQFLVDVDPAIHGERVRRLLKRWLGEALSDKFGKPDGERWWAVQGSNIAIHDERYLNNACRYVFRQRAQRENGVV